MNGRSHPAQAAPAPSLTARVTRDEPVPLRQTVAGLLALSAERDAQLAARLAAWREGYATGAAEERAAGYAAAIADVKRDQHELAAAVRLGLARSAPGGAAWLWSVLRHGATEYGGQGRSRVPVPTTDIERVLRERR